MSLQIELRLKTLEYTDVAKPLSHVTLDNSKTYALGDGNEVPCSASNVGPP